MLAWVLWDSENGFAWVAWILINVACVVVKVRVGLEKLFLENGSVSLCVKCTFFSILTLCELQ